MAAPVSEDGAPRTEMRREGWPAAKTGTLLSVRGGKTRRRVVGKGAFQPDTAGRREGERSQPCAGSAIYC